MMSGLEKKLLNYTAFLGESGLMHQLIRPESELGDKVEIQRLWFSFLQKSLRAKLLAASGQNL